MAALDEATVALIRIDYEESSLTVQGIGDKFGKSASYICRLAREGGWIMRTERMGRRARRTSPLSSAGRALIAHRLCGVINRKIDQMEQGMSKGELSSSDLERDAKTIASMIGGMEKATAALDEDKVMRADAAEAGSGAGIDDVERLQRAIIERFASIQRRREAEGGSG